MARRIKINLPLIAVFSLMIALLLFSCIPVSPQQKNAAQLPVIVTKPDRMVFTVDPGNTAVLEQVISVVNAGGGVFNWSMSDNVRWLALQKILSASGSESSIKVVVDASGMDPGEYTGIITISAEGAANTQVYVPVDLNILRAAGGQPITVQTPPADQQSASPPGSSSIVWNNQNEFMRYATTNACVVSGSITNTDKRWYLTDVSIAAKSGSSVNIAKMIPPGETVVYYRFIPCFQRQDVTLQYNWQAP